MASMQFLSSPTTLGDSFSSVITVVGDSSSPVMRTVSPIPLWDCPECYNPKITMECQRCQVPYHPAYRVDPTNGTNVNDMKQPSSQQQSNGTSLLSSARGCWRCHMNDNDGNDVSWQWWRPCHHCNALTPLCSSSIPILSSSPLPTFKCRYCQHNNDTQELWCYCGNCLENNKFIDSSCSQCELLSLPSPPSSKKKRSRSEQSDNNDIDIKQLRTVV